VNEGGGFHVNGAGKVLVTETVQLGKGRNPSATKAQVEQELNQLLGTNEVIWFKRGLTRDYEDYGTQGHIDIVACFVNETTVLFHDQQDQGHPDFLVSAEVRQTILDAGLTPLTIPAPKILRDEVGWVDYSYVNHYLVNGGVILCAFNDENDEKARAIIQDCYPDREIVLVDAREIFARGGGIHCITQQQPI
jgi:agmatine deiminase